MIDSFGESVVVGYNSGLINLFELSDTVDVTKIIPTRTIRNGVCDRSCYHLKLQNPVTGARWYKNETLPENGRFPLCHCKTDPHYSIRPHDGLVER